MEDATFPIRTVQVSRYITPLREGGSMPGLIEADDGFLYVLKFRGAGQGIKALIAELIGGELARHLQLKVPELVFAELDEAFGRTEPDEEIQDLFRFSTGLNLAMHFLSGAVTFDPAIGQVDPDLASRILWLDALLANVDRTVRNTNLLVWHKELWLIDHGAGLYFHHNWENWEAQAERPFAQLKDHVLFKNATLLDETNSHFQALIQESDFLKIVNLIPEDWLLNAGFGIPPLEIRHMYVEFLKQRLAAMPEILQLNENGK